MGVSTQSTWGRVNRSKTGMNGTKPNRTNRSPSASMAGNRSAPGAASTLGRGGEVGSDRITRVNRHPLPDSVQVGSGTVLRTEASPGEKEISRFTRILRRFRGGSPRGFVRFAKSALGIERVANALAEIFSPGYLGGDSSGNSAGGLGVDDVVKGPEEVVLDAWRSKPLTKTCRLVTYYCDIMFDPKVFDELGAQGVVVDGKTVALEDLISAMTARYDSEDNVLRLVAQITFATLRTLVVAGVFG